MQDTPWSLFPKIMFIFTDLISLYWPEPDSDGVTWLPKMLSRTSGEIKLMAKYNKNCQVVCFSSETFVHNGESWRLTLFILVALCQFFDQLWEFFFLISLSYSSTKTTSVLLSFYFYSKTLMCFLLHIQEFPWRYLHFIICVFAHFHISSPIVCWHHYFRVAIILDNLVPLVPHRWLPTPSHCGQVHGKITPIPPLHVCWDLLIITQSRGSASYSRLNHGCPLTPNAHILTLGTFNMLLSMLPYKGTLPM